MKHFDDLILASSSPRRKQLLSDAGFYFETRTIPFDEVVPADMQTWKVAEYLAIEKNKAHRDAFKLGTILTADTVVILSDSLLGKPKDETEAMHMLRLLSGKVHHVMTGVCISTIQKVRSFSTTTEVKFKTLTDAEVAHYLNHQPPMDKAGSYGIQDWIGMIGISWIKGSYYNVMGLPTSEVYHLLINEF